MSPKRILIFSLAYHPMIGGAEIAIKEISDRISNIEFDLVTPRFSKNYPKVEKISNINVYRIGLLARPDSPLGYLSKILFIPQASIFAFKRKYHLYWAMMTYMLFPIVLLRWFGRDDTPYVLTLQDGDPFEHVFSRFHILPFLPMLLYGFRHATRIQTISNFLAEWARRMGYMGKLEVIPNGVDLNSFQFKAPDLKKDKITLITTSRLVKKNAVGDIIRALKFLSNNVLLTVVGTGPLEESLKSQVKNLKLENRVRFVGSVEPLYISNYLHGADIFVRPSISEGQGISFIEAMAAGLPIIGTPVGGIPDFLIHEKTGLFVEVNNPQSIAKAVERLIVDEPLRNRIIENAQRMAREKYNWDLISKEMKSKVFNDL